MTLRGLYSRFPSLNCGACFVPTCRSFARRCLLGLNSARECPVLEWAEGGAKARDAEEATRSHSAVRVSPEAKVMGTPFSMNHPIPNDKMVEFLDAEALSDIMRAAKVFDSVKSFAGLDAIRVSKGAGSLLIVSQGLVLPTGPGPPTMTALSSLAGLIWGAANRVWADSPQRRASRLSSALAADALIALLRPGPPAHVP